MQVNVRSDIEIDRPREDVAAFAANPNNVPAWYQNIKSVEWESTPELRVGARIAFVAEFLGRRLAYTYEIVEYAPGERLVMRTSQGPFPMETRYEWWSTALHGTHMTLTNTGYPSGFSRWVAPFISIAIRRANKKDLQRLKQLLEQR